MLCSHFVLDTVLHACYRVALDRFRRGARSRRSQRREPARSCGRPRKPGSAGGRPWVSSQLVRLKRTVREVPSGSSISLILIEPGCPSRHPRSTSRLRAPKPWANRCWLCETSIPRPTSHPPTSWPGLTRPSQSDERGAPGYRDHRNRPGDDRRSVRGPNEIASGTRHQPIGITGTSPVMTSE
jgi:hypothetical protein